VSQEISTVLASCGLMVGLNMAPPPPGPMTRKLPGRSAEALLKHEAIRIAGRKRSFISSCLMLDEGHCRAPSAAGCDTQGKPGSGRRPNGTAAEFLHINF